MFCNKCGKKIDEPTNFCPGCGNKLENVQQPVTQVPTNNNVQQNVVQTNVVQPNVVQQNVAPKKSNKKKMIIGGSVGAVIVLVIIIVLLVGGVAGRNGYFFSAEGYETNENINSATQNVGSSSRTGKYSTAIIYDNTYSGAKIESSKDAYDLIIKDSVTQKDKCPEEIKSIEDDIINKYGIPAINLCEMNLDFAREIENVIDRIYNEYPSARGYLTNMSLANVSMSEGYIAAFMPMFTFAQSSSDTGYPLVIKSQILLNTSYFLNPDRLQASVRDGSNSGHFPKNATLYSPVAHEFGHYLSFLAMMKNHNKDSILIVDTKDVSVFGDLYLDFGNGTYSLSMIKEAYDNYKRDTNTTLTLDEWRGTISKYALAKDNSGNYIYDETIAESFHDVYLNGDQAADASKYVIQVLKKKLGN